MCFLAGKSSSAPARSKPTTPLFLKATVRSASFRLISGLMCRMPPQDDARPDAIGLLGHPQPLQHGLHDGVKGEALLLVEDGAVPDLQVPDILPSRNPQPVQKAVRTRLS